MGIAVRDRKLLWGKSGSLCAICRQPLIRKLTNQVDGDAIIGEEAHIVGQGNDGPRAGSIPNDDVDRYENLILLCANDHTLVDKDVTGYSVERLTTIKRQHEQWVLGRLTSLPTSEAIGWSPIAPGAPIVLPRLTTGREAYNTISGSLTYRVDSPPDGYAAEAVCDAADEFLQILTDWGEVSEAVNDRGRAAIRDAERSLSESLAELESHGLVAFGAQRGIRLGSETSPSFHGAEAVVVVRLASDVMGLNSLIALIEAELLR